MRYHPHPNVFREDFLLHPHPRGDILSQLRISKRGNLCGNSHLRMKLTSLGTWEGPNPSTSWLNYGIYITKLLFLKTRNNLNVVLTLNFDFNFNNLLPTKNCLSLNLFNIWIVISTFYLYFEDEKRSYDLLNL
jgi:hypothetical protein